MSRLEPREPAPQHAPPAASRRVTDERGRGWSVRDIASPVRAHGTGRVIGRIWSCDVAEPIPELRRPWRPSAHGGGAAR